MSGVIGDDGVQWERTNCCGRWCRYSDLRYGRPHPRYPTQYEGDLDLCPDCADGLDHRNTEQYDPPPSRACRYCGIVNCDDDCEERAAIYREHHRNQMRDIILDDDDIDTSGRGCDSYGSLS